MRSNVRFALLAPLIGVILALVAISAPAAQAATEFGPEILVAGNCTKEFKTCGSDPSTGPYAFPEEPTEAEARTEGYNAGGWASGMGITDFKVNTEATLPNDVPSGLATDRSRQARSHRRRSRGQHQPRGSAAVHDRTVWRRKEAVPGTGLYPAPACKPETEIGVNQVTVLCRP